MDDLISRQGVIDYVLEHGFYCDTEADKEYTAELIRTVFPSAQQWIPCSERLPHSQEDVLCDDDGRVTIGYYTDEEIGWHDTHSYRIYPTAWMPMPEPYREDANG